MTDSTKKEYKVEDFEIVNLEKWDRALHGSLGREGRLEGGIGDDATDIEKLAAYDKLGGLIKKDGRIVKQGSFWDFKTRSVKNNPKIEYVFRDIEGNEVILADDEKVPMEVKAAELVKARTGVAIKPRRGRPAKRNMGNGEKIEEQEVDVNADINADDE